MAKSKKKTPKTAEVTDEKTIVAEEMIREVVEVVDAEKSEENPTEPQKTEETEPKDPKRLALEEFAAIWNSMTQHNYMSDEQARKVHKLWQTYTGRTDFYVNCSVCSSNHIKTLKKHCKNVGIYLK